MNILIIGYGKMGKMVEEIALSKSDTIVGIIDKEEDWENFDKNNSFKDVVAIDFSIPSKVLDNIEKAWERNIAIVVGTTGWYDKLEEITQRANQEGKTLFWASNFSIGVFLFNKLNASLANMMKDFSDYKPQITEIHHIHKLDAPSGTAITLAQTLVENHNIKKEDLKKIFDKFFRVHTGNRHDVKGFGLGLCYVRSVIKNHKGNIHADSVPDEGTTFYIELPYKH